MDVFKFALKYKIIFRGRAIEFAGLREYTENDDSSLIDWKATVRLAAGGKIQKAYVKVFEQERDLDVFVLLDTSSSMIFGTRDKLKTEYAAVLAGAITYAAIEARDSIGFALFSNKVHKMSPPSKEDYQYNWILDAMIEPKNYGGKPDLELALNSISGSLGNKTFLFIISDFIGFKKEWENALKSASARFSNVLGIMVRDPADSVLPAGAGKMRISNPVSSGHTVANFDKLKAEYDRTAKEQEEKIKEAFENGGAGFIKVYTNEEFIPTLIKYFDVHGAG